jgi:hypothetical protein|tara:strand:- start:242 stop:433 length:192 start_codon:yes stop_codon:yes gene_type:complete
MTDSGSPHGGHTIWKVDLPQSYKTFETQSILVEEDRKREHRGAIKEVLINLLMEKPSIKKYFF